MKDNKKAETFRSEGNALFNHGKFYEALILYNKSLCHAVSQSNHLALAYANRSAIYLELKQFDKCLDNIQLARDFNYENTEKLKEREAKCAKFMEVNKHDDAENDPASFFKLSYAANEKIPSIANCLKVSESEKFGRYIVTTQELHPGDIVAIEEPIFKTIESESRYSRCTYCLNSNMLSLIPCDGFCASSKNTVHTKELQLNLSNLHSDVLQRAMSEGRTPALPQR